MTIVGRMHTVRTVALLLILSTLGLFAVTGTTQANLTVLQGTPVATPATPLGRDPVIMAAGDIACGSASLSAKCKQNATADLIVEGNPDAVLALGDNQYECGQLDDYHASFDPSWGRFKAKIHPVPGNHEYQVSKADGDCPTAQPNAPGYYTYFGDAASPLEPGCRVACKGYYSWDLGDWHFIALNSECSRKGVDGCNAHSAQYQWLVDDLAKHKADCTLAYWHEPRFSSGHHGSFVAYEPFWQALYEGGADIVLNGHDHDYERFAPQTPNGELDHEFGIREFVVGTGGRNHTSPANGSGTILNSETFDNTTFGVIKLTLHPSGYDWQFVPVTAEGTTPFTDAGSDTCHSAPPAGRATPVPSIATPVNVATPVAGWTPFVDGFESGKLDQWKSATGLFVQTDDVASGTYAVEATTSGPPAFARKILSVPQPELYYRLRFKLINRKPATINLLKFRTPDDGSIVSFGIGREGNLSFRNDVTKTTFRSDTAVTNGIWHEVQVRLFLNGDASEIEVWLDGTHVDDLTRIESFDASAIGIIQLGDNSPGTGFDIVFDDVAVDTHMISDEGPDTDDTG